ncbi:MAG: hypothetical protein SXQ77_05055 [Halobacteria archaeon]|nr:hypothetical protein [Halobacteria archaeon]
MSESSPAATEPQAESLVNLPSQSVGYLMVGTALVTGVITYFSR